VAVLVAGDGSMWRRLVVVDVGGVCMGSLFNVNKHQYSKEKEKERTYQVTRDMVVVEGINGWCRFKFQPYCRPASDYFQPANHLL
jgi:hypothetical protein